MKTSSMKLAHQDKKARIGSDPLGLAAGEPAACVLSALLPVPLISQAVLKDKKKVGNHTPTDGSLVSYSLFRGKQLRFISFFFFFFFYSYIMVNFQLQIYF